MRPGVPGCTWCLVKPDFSPRGKEGTLGSHRECCPAAPTGQVLENSHLALEFLHGRARAFPRTAQGKLHGGCFQL